MMRPRALRRVLILSSAVSLALAPLLWASPVPVAQAASTPSASTPSASATSAGTPTATPSESRPAGHRGHGGSPVTVRGPHMWNPSTMNATTGTGKQFAQASTVTVSQTTGLVNQMLYVSWTGFTPSVVNGSVYRADATDYPVMVVECRGSAPHEIGQCYDATEGGVANSLGAASNAAYATTAANGTGEAYIPIQTVVQNQVLGCDASHPCSLAIVPSQGGNEIAPPYSCDNHLYDSYGSGAGMDTGSNAFGGSTTPCSWASRIIVPLKFAADPLHCPIQNASFSVLGSPMMQTAMEQWNTGLCAGSHPLVVQYSSALPEPEAISAVQSGLGDVALTTRPAATTVAGNRHYTYAPVAVSAVSIAYWVDNPVTFQPYTHLKLNPRLVAKMLTTSYDYNNEGCGPSQTANCDSATDGNPISVLVDPEFTQLNPQVRAPASVGGLAEVPMVQSGHSDMTYEVTRWIAANPAASGFLGGQFDPWGMHINTAYLGLKYPTDGFISEDPYPEVARAYSPVFPLSAIASDMVQNSPPGTQAYLSIDPTDNEYNYARLPQEQPGGRVLFAVMDEADAAAFLIPVAAILNHAGRYVEPTQSAMSAALQSMVTSPDGVTQQVRTNSDNPAEYPLTMVIYAMVPTSGVSAAKAANIARWLDFVAGAGQISGSLPGQLPVGYLPLPARLRAETLKAADQVANQTGRTRAHHATPAPKPSPSPSPSQSPSLSPSPATTVRTSPAPSPRVSFPTVRPKIALVAVRNPVSSGLTRYVLPVLLIVGGLAVLAGASLLVAGTSGAAIRARLRRRHYVRTVRRSKT